MSWGKLALELRFGQKLVICFLTLLAVSILVGFMAVWRIREIHSSEMTFLHQCQAVSTLHRSHARVAELGLLASRLIDADSGEKRRRIGDQLSGKLAEFDRLMASLSSSGSDALLDSPAYPHFRSVLLELRREAGQPKRQSYYEERVRPAFSQLNSAIDARIAAGDVAVSAARMQAEQRFRQSAASVFGMFLFTALLSLVGALFLSRGSPARA